MPSKTEQSGVERGTGRDRPEWFALLDAWGAAGKAYREVAAWLAGEHGLSAWWAQKLTVEYQESRGLRPAGVRPDGTFEVGASKAIRAPVDKVVAAFVEPAIREGWLPGVSLTARETDPARPLRFDWDGGGSRVVVTSAAAADKTQVTLLHQRIASAEQAAELKTVWRTRLDALKAALEG